MARRTSPFADLTSEEKQLKWLEYQSVRLPYVSGQVDGFPDEHCDEHEEHQQKQTEESSHKVNEPIPYLIHTSSEYQKSRHRQYDAVIARMKQAEKRIGQFSEWSK